MTDAAGSSPAPAVALTEHFSLDLFENPDAVHWPGVFWLWNAPLEPETLEFQLRDMAAHGCRSVCVLPLPHAFRPENTNNEMSPDYLTPEYQERIRYAAGLAAELGMNWWLYDEGGWPSGQACGKVAENRPGFLQQNLVRERVPASSSYTVPPETLALVVETPSLKVLEPGETWTPASEQDLAYLYRVQASGYVDLMNPEVTRRFIEITHDAYGHSLGPLLGGTVRFTFTDEPNCPNLRAPDSITWTDSMDRLWARRYGSDIRGFLLALFTPPALAIAPDTARTRIHYYDLWTGRFRDAYFLPLRDWCRERGLASGGHLNGEEETANAVRYGFGQALRQLRALDVPGVDVIWRQLFPGAPNQHYFPKYASSVAHQNALRYAMTESFCVYGNGLTPAQMKWIVDYQYVRGLNLLVMGCYPLGTRDHHMTGERPHYGPVNPLWDHLRGFNAYTARLGCALSCGVPRIDTALYYPIRDLWAWGESATAAVGTHDRLALELLASQCDFDLIDDDILADPSSTAKEEFLNAGAMRYKTIIIGDACWIQPESLEKLKAFARSGGRVFCVGHPPGSYGLPGPPFENLAILPAAENLGEHLEPTARITPPCRELRVTARTTREGELLFLFNEGTSPYSGGLAVAASQVMRLDPQNGACQHLRTSGATLLFSLEAGESLLLWLGDTLPEAAVVPVPVGEPRIMNDAIMAKPLRRRMVGEHDFEVVLSTGEAVPFARAAEWKPWLGGDYSGEAEYCFPVEIAGDWAGAPLRLDTGPVEYAATVLVDGVSAGQMLWAPWRIELPPLHAGTHQVVLRVANTLANELTSKRVADIWAGKSGPGWPSPYHERALKFEQESRGGGLHGPVTLTRLARDIKQGQL